MNIELDEIINNLRIVKITRLVGGTSIADFPKVGWINGQWRHSVSIEKPIRKQVIKAAKLDLNKITEAIQKKFYEVDFWAIVATENRKSELRDVVIDADEDDLALCERCTDEQIVRKHLNVEKSLNNAIIEYIEKSPERAKERAMLDAQHAENEVKRKAAIKAKKERDAKEYCNKGLAKLKLGDEISAKEYFLKAKRLDPNIVCQ